MNKEELNQLALERVENLREHGHFETITITDERISKNEDPFNKGFYYTQQDVLNYAYGEILTDYYTLKAELKRYIAVRKFQYKIEAEETKSKVPGNEILEDLVKSEVDELYKAVLILEGWVERAENSIRTCRSHCYSETTEREDKPEKRE